MDKVYGMGIKLNFVDNASGGVDRVVTSLNAMANASLHAQEAFLFLNFAGNTLSNTGKNVLNFGKSIISVFADLGKQVLETGSTFETTRMTLEALYKSKGIAESKLNWALNFSMKTPFELTDVNKALMAFKATGIEVDSLVTSATGKTQEFMSYIGDLYALKKDTLKGGMGQLIYAVQNAVGGNLRGLRTALDIPAVDTYLGRKMGTTPEQIKKDIADITAKLGAEGLMDKLNGTWSQLLSNMKDATTKFFLGIADSGAFDTAKNVLKKIYDIIVDITSNKKELQAISKTFSEVFSVLFKPVELLANAVVKIIGWVREMNKTNPKLLKTMMIVAGIVGGVLAFAGAIMMASGGLISFVASIAVINHQWGALTNMFTSLRLQAGALALKLLPLVIITTLLAIAWKKNLGGFRDFSMKVINDVKFAFSSASKIMNLPLENFRTEINKLQSSKSILDSFTLALVKLGTLGTGLADALPDNKMSKGTYEKLKSMGLLPIINGFLDLKNIVVQISKGFATEFGKVYDTVKGVVERIIELNTEFEKFLGSIGLLQKSGVSETKWEGFGRILADIAIFIVGVKALSFVGGIFKSILGIFRPLVTLATKFFGLLGRIIFGIRSFAGGASTIFESIAFAFPKLGGIIARIATFFGPVATFFSNLIFAIQAVAGGAATIGEGFAFAMPGVFGFLSAIGGAITAVLAGIGIVITAPAWVVGAIAVAIVALIALIVIFRKQIASFFVNLWTGIVNAMQNNPVGKLVLAWWGVLFRVVKVVFMAIVSVVMVAFNILKTIFLFFFNGAKGVFMVLFSVVSRVFNTIAKVVLSVLRFIGALFVFLFTLIKVKVIDPFVNFFVNVWNILFRKPVSDFCSWITGVIDYAIGAVQKSWQSIGTFFENLWKDMTQNVDNAVKLILQFLDPLIKVFESIGDFISNIFNKSADALNGATNVLNNGLVVTTDTDVNPQVGLATGGYVKEKGVAMLHPNEVVVNDDLTTNLRAFLDRQRGNFTALNSSSSQSSSVVVKEGAIQINVPPNATQVDLDRIADTIIKRIKRESEISNMRNYKPLKV